jgi:hypothetical protein
MEQTTSTKPRSTPINTLNRRRSRRVSCVDRVRRAFLPNVEISVARRYFERNRSVVVAANHFVDIGARAERIGIFEALDRVRRQ